MVKALNLRQKSIHLDIDGEAREFKPILRRDVIKKIRPLLKSIYKGWIKSYLDTAKLIESDEYWDEICKLSALFSIDANSLTPHEIEALFITQNRNAALNSEAELEERSIGVSVLSDGSLYIRMTEFALFFPGILIEQSCIDGREVFRKEYADHLQSFVDREAEEKEAKELAEVGEAEEIGKIEAEVEADPDTTKEDKEKSRTQLELVVAS